MLPQTVGEIKALIKDLPDNMLFDLNLRSCAAIEDADLQVEEQNGRKVLVLNIRMDD